MKKCGSLEKEPYRELCHRDRTRMSWLDNITEWTQSTFKRHSGIQRIENSGEGQSIMWSTLGSRKTEGKARRCHSSSLVSGRMRQTDWRRSTVVCMGRRLSVKLPPRLDCRRCCCCCRCRDLLSIQAMPFITVLEAFQADEMTKPGLTTVTGQRSVDDHCN